MDDSRNQHLMCERATSTWYMIKTCKQRLLYSKPNKEVQRLKDRLKALKAELQEARKLLVRFSKISFPLHKSVESCPAIHAAETRRALRKIPTMAVAGEELNYIEKKLEDVELLLQEICNLTNLRHLMDRYKRKSSACDTESSKWPRLFLKRVITRKAFVAYQAEFDLAIECIEKDAKKCCQFARDLHDAEQNVLNCLRKSTTKSMGMSKSMALV